MVAASADALWVYSRAAIPLWDEERPPTPSFAPLDSDVSYGRVGGCGAYQKSELNNLSLSDITRLPNLIPRDRYCKLSPARVLRTAITTCLHRLQGLSIRPAFAPEYCSVSRRASLPFALHHGMMDSTNVARGELYSLKCHFLRFTEVSLCTFTLLHQLHPGAGLGLIGRRSERGEMR